MNDSGSGLMLPGAGLVVVAAGVGSRLDAGVHKALVSLDGMPLALFTLRRLMAGASFDSVVLVAHPDDCRDLEEQLADSPVPVQVVPGGARRQDSVSAGLAALAEHGTACEVVLVHDAARPFAPLESLPRLADEARRHGCALLASPVPDTLKAIRNGQSGTPLETPVPRSAGALPSSAEATTDAEIRVERTVPRAGLWAAQTPQAFRCRDLAELLAGANRKGQEVTDEAGLFEAAGREVRIVEGSRFNFKITTADDLELARAWHARQQDKAHPAPGDGGKKRSSA
jgi:2-C-methyl-D-erythritol 4-phosphate cytidylyltransferase